MSVQYTMAAHTARTPGPTSPRNLTRCSPCSMPNSTTPLASPRPPYSVGQNHPPLTSPTRSSQGARPPSPNYFGLVLEPSAEFNDSAAPARENWSPASSSIRSFAAAIPKTVPLEPNPEFEAFRRQADRNHGFAAVQGPKTSASALAPPNPQAKRPRPSRWHSHSTDRAHDPAAFRTALNRIRAEVGTAKTETDRDSSHDSAYVSMESKRNSDSSLMPPQWQNMPTIVSPLAMDESEPASTHSKPPERDPRLSYFDPKLMHKSGGGLPEVARAATLPSKLVAGEAPMLSVEQLKSVMDDTPQDRLMLLDIRSAQSYSQSRIQNALNLCIPTTLLKRATFNIEKLQQTFQSGPESGKFAGWRDMDWIVVYDAHASDPKDAVTAQNMIKKFTTAGFAGKTGILRGGFAHFRSSFPRLIDEKNVSSQGSAARPSLSKAGPGGLAPVIGGVNLPTSMNSANPFFSNIRQNMDLADGVGQFDVGRPDNLDVDCLPNWLRDAAAVEDHGKAVSQKFLNIELEEQSRMRGAYAAFNPNNATENKVQLCGVEKGVKNRYKDILPFEHARVRLATHNASACDYVNASHISASRSNKKYIATQGPLPATFEDFWSVAWEQDVRVIVMLTATSEGGQLKCHPYWEEQEYGQMRLRALSEKRASLDMDRHRSDSADSPKTASAERSRPRANTTTAFESASSSAAKSETPYVVIRKFALSHAAHPFAAMREITHLHFPGWPDFGTPAQPSHLLALVELANLTQRAAMPVETGSVSRGPGLNVPISWYDEPESDSNSRPMIVHCSAGCGRTGTFCTVDSVIDMLKRKRQAKASAPGKTDAQGDTAMTDASEEVSPFTGAAAAPASAAAAATASATGPESYFETNLGAKVSRVSMPMEGVEADGEAHIDTRFLQDDGVDLVQKTVEDFRQQRLSMVQSLRQYVLCYETVLEWVNRTQSKSATSADGRKRSGSLSTQQA